MLCMMMCVIIATDDVDVLSHGASLGASLLYGKFGSHVMQACHVGHHVSSRYDCEY